MAEYQPRIAHLSPKQVQPFSKLVDEVWTQHRGRRPSAEILGVSEAVLRRCREKGELTDKQARLILMNYRKWKAQEGKNHG